MTAPHAPVIGGRQDDPPRRPALALGLPGTGHRVDVMNDLSLLVGDPNVTIHEAKAFVCNVEKA